MQPRKLIVYLILGVTVVYGFQFHFLSDRNGKARAEYESKTMSPASVDSGPIGPGAELSPRINQRKKDGPDWKKDPFRNDRRTGDTTVRKKPSTVRLPDKPKVSAISRTGGQIVVIADGRMLRIGEKTGPWRLVDVGNEAALFDGPGGKTWIRLGGSR